MGRQRPLQKKPKKIYVVISQLDGGNTTTAWFTTKVEAQRAFRDQKDRAPDLARQERKHVHLYLFLHYTQVFQEEELQRELCRLCEKNSSSALLHEVFHYGGDPNLSPKALLDLATKEHNEVLANPALPLVALEDPATGHEIISRAQKAKRRAEVEAEINRRWWSLSKNHQREVVLEVFHRALNKGAELWILGSEDQEEHLWTTHPGDLLDDLMSRLARVPSINYDEERVWLLSRLRNYTEESAGGVTAPPGPRADPLQGKTKDQLLDLRRRIEDAQDAHGLMERDVFEFLESYESDEEALEALNAQLDGF